MLTIETVVPPDHRLMLNIPSDIPAGPAKISIKTLVPKKENNKDLLNFLDKLAKDKSKPRKSDAEIEAIVKELRESWGD